MEVFGVLYDQQFRNKNENACNKTQPIKAEI